MKEIYNLINYRMIFEYILLFFQIMNNKKHIYIYIFHLFVDNIKI